MGYLGNLRSKFKKIKNRENGRYKEEFKTEISMANQSRFRVLSVTIIIIYLIFILTIDLYRFQNKTLFVTSGFIWIAAGRLAILALALLAFLASSLSRFIGEKNNKLFIKIEQIFLVPIIFLAFVVNAIGDYIILGSIETFIGISLAFAILIYMTDKYSLAFFGLNFLLFIGLINELTPNESFISATLFTNCISFSLFSFVVSRINYYSRLTSFHQKLIIINQKDKLKELSVLDQLTRIYNRRKFDDLMAKEIDRANRYMQKFSIVMFDIDNFKYVNDTYGHLVGDTVLIEISTLVKNNLRKTDSIARWGGEEFIVIASETTLQNATNLGEKLRRIICNYHFKEVGKITSSFGISEYLHQEKAEAMLSRADRALYIAKENGKNRVENKYITISKRPDNK